MAKKDYTQLKIIGGIAVLVYVGVLNPILKALGIKDDDTDVANERAMNNPGWNPNLYKSNIANKLLISSATATALAQKIWDSWAWYNDDEESVYAVFRQIPNQLALSQVSEKYIQISGEDLVSSLVSRLSWNEFNVIAVIVNGLPQNR